MKYKKSQGLSLNTIIVAAIVLIVLIVLWAIFTGRMGGFSSGYKDTAEGQKACNDLCGALGIYGDSGHIFDTPICTATYTQARIMKVGDDNNYCCCNKGTTASADQTPARTSYSHNCMSPARCTQNDGKESSIDNCGMCIEGEICCEY